MFGIGTAIATLKAAIKTPGCLWSGTKWVAAAGTTIAIGTYAGFPLGEYGIDTIDSVVRGEVIRDCEEFTIPEGTKTSFQYFGEDIDIQYVCKSRFGTYFFSDKNPHLDNFIIPRYCVGDNACVPMDKFREHELGSSKQEFLDEIYARGQALTTGGLEAKANE